MALAYNQYLGNGATKVYSLAFPYISRAHVQVRVNGTDVPFVWLTDTTVELATAPAPNAVVDIRRVTPRDELLVDFKDASTLVETDLDLSALQVFYLAQEFTDLGDASLGVTDDGSFSALNRRISRVMDPQLPQDAVTKLWAETALSSQLAQAITAKNDAVTARSAAQTARTGAETAQTGAQTARTGAETAKAGADTAKAGADTAKAGAEAARDAALGHANTALGHANSASGSASTATTKAAEAAASAVQAATFDPANFYTKTQSYSKSEVDAKVAAGGVPIGASIYWNDPVIPTGFLKENGAAYSRAAYPELFAKIGTRFGAGDGSTTFNVPDSRAEFIRGLDDGRGIDSGRALGSAQGDAMRNLTGRVSFLVASSRNVVNATSGVFDNPSANNGAAGSTTGNYGGSSYFDINASLQVPTAAENRPRNVSKLVLIRAF